MKLKTVHFDAYRSIHKASLEFTHECMGLVGINESGKTNVLTAIGSLSPDNKLLNSDSPKMSRKDDPCIRFEFELQNEELDAAKEALSKWNSLDSLDISRLSVTYHVHFNKSDQTEERFFELHGISLPRNMLCLRLDALTDGYMVKIGDEYVQLDDIILLNKAAIQENTNLFGYFNQLVKCESEIQEIKLAIESIEDNATSAEVNEGETAVTPEGDEQKSESPKNLVKTVSTQRNSNQLQSKLKKLIRRKDNL